MEEEIVNQTMEEKQPYINYKIKANKDYIVTRNDYAGKIYYKIEIEKKNYDDTIQKCFKNVKFITNDNEEVDIPNGTQIRIKQAFEDFYFRKADKFNPIFYLVITDYEITKNSDEITKEAYENYYKTEENFDIF